MSAPRWFEVISAECASINRILDDGTGPMEYWHDSLYVRASSPQRAKTLFVRAWRRRTRGKRWTAAPWLYDGNPFAGMSCIPLESPPLAPAAPSGQEPTS